MTGIEIVGAVLVLAPIVTQLLRFLNARIANEKASAVLSTAEQAALYIEEFAAENPGLVSSGKEKLDAATRQVLVKHTGISQPQAEKIVKSVLPKLGLGAAAKLRAAAPSPADMKAAFGQ